MFDEPTDSFSWAIVGGTGDYAALHGAGTGVGTELGTGVDDHYVGKVAA